MPTKVISVSNQKGGVGKTTTTISLAACISEFGKRVLVVDIDPQGNATSGLGMEKEEGGSIYGPLLGYEDAMDKIVETPFDNLSIIPGELNLAGSEVEVARADNYQTALRDALKPVIDSDRFDYILIDCPPSIGILTMNALTASNSVLVPFQCEYFALEGIAAVKKIIQTIRQSGTNPTLHFEGIVLTMFDKRTNLGQQVAQEVRNFFRDLVYETTIPRNVRLSEAPSHGLPISWYDPDSAGAIAYRSLAKEFLLRSMGPGTPIYSRSSDVKRPAPPSPRVATLSKDDDED